MSESPDHSPSSALTDVDLDPIARSRDWSILDQTENVKVEKEIAILETDVQMVDLRIAETKQMLQSLEDNKALLERHKQEYAALQSPIRKLPVELLQDIFEICSTGTEITNSKYPGSSSLSVDNPGGHYRRTSNLKRTN